MEVNALDQQMKQNLVTIKIVQKTVNGKASVVWKSGRKGGRERRKYFATLKIVLKSRISCKINLKLLKHSLSSYKGLVQRFCNFSKLLPNISLYFYFSFKDQSWCSSLKTSAKYILIVNFFFNKVQLWGNSLKTCWIYV